ncbi:hypothetical protein M9H77_35445 [Catharanthus roseus]|uniref:Uncharacterized protein n=1 Tax=Catharanthus roseus TaxID=4058 RepID=A0ACB9ZPS6_CATRO|nr:hypothetical protein M9H77_35445 [Catharanthus roseus]
MKRLHHGQIADIKVSLEFSKTKEKNNAESNHMFYIVNNKITVGIYDDPKNKCGHYLRTSHGLSCACELITQFDHVLPIQLHDIDAFWKTLEIGDHHPSAWQQDIDYEMRSLTDLLHQISTGPISKVREMHRLAKGKSSGSVSGSGTGSSSLSGSGSGSGSCGRGRPPLAPRERGRGRDRCRIMGSEERVTELVHRIHWPVDGPAPYAHWFETPDSLYIIAYTFNLCVILIAQLGFMIVLPLYSYSNRPEGTLVIGLMTEQRHFIQSSCLNECVSQLICSPFCDPTLQTS